MNPHAPPFPVHGVATIRRLGAVDPATLTDERGDLLGTIRTDLRSSRVNLVFRVLAREPRYLSDLWDALGPIVRSDSFEAAASWPPVRTTPLPDRSPPGLTPTQHAAVRSAVTAARRVVPRLHLIIAALVLGVDDAADLDRQPHDPMQPAGTPSSTLARVAHAYGHPIPASFHRSLDDRHGTLDRVWPWLRRWIRSPGYEGGRRDLVTAAEERAGQTGLADVVRGVRTDALQVLSPADLAAVVAVFHQGYAPDVALTADALDRIPASHGGDGREDDA